MDTGSCARLWCAVGEATRGHNRLYMLHSTTDIRKRRALQTRSRSCWPVTEIPTELITDDWSFSAAGCCPWRMGAAWLAQAPQPPFERLSSLSFLFFLGGGMDHATWLQRLPGLLYRLAPVEDDVQAGIAQFLTSTDLFDHSGARDARDGQNNPHAPRPRRFLDLTYQTCWPRVVHRPTVQRLAWPAKAAPLSSHARSFTVRPRRLSERHSFPSRPAQDSSVPVSSLHESASAPHLLCGRVVARSQWSEPGPMAQYVPIPGSLLSAPLFPHGVTPL